MKQLIRFSVLFFLTCLSVAAQGSGTGTGKASGTGSWLVTPSGGGGGSPAGWNQVPGTTLSGLCPTYSDIQGNTGCAAVQSAWGSMLIDNTRSAAIIHGGGHVDYGGNEIYECVFTSLTAGSCSLMQDTNHGSAYDAVQVACGESATGPTAPNSRHDYSGFWYIPNKDQYFLYGAGIATCGNFSDGNWVYDPKTLAWTHLAPSTHPATASNGSVPQMAYNPPDGCLYFLENNIPNFWKSCYDANGGSVNWTALTGPSGAPCDSTNSDSAIDVSRQLFVCAGGGNLYTISLSTSTTVNDTAASGCSGPANATAPGIAYDPIQQLIVFWLGGSNVVTYNATTHSCSTVTLSGGPGAQLSNGTYNRFQWMPSIGGFVLANGMGSNMWTLQLVAPATAAIDDYNNRVAAAGVTNSQNFDSAGLFVQVTSGPGFYSPDTGQIAARDTTTYRSGTSSARYSIPGLSSDEPLGWYALPYNFNLTVGLTVYFSFAQKMDSNYILQQAPQTGGGFTYFKQFTTAWWDGVNNFNSCGNPEFTMVNDFNEGFPLGYLACGDDGLQVSSSISPTGLYNEFNYPLITSGTYNGTSQTLTGGSLPAQVFNCPYSSTQPNADCFDYPANVWVTYMCAITQGTFAAAASTLQCWTSTPTSPAWKQFIYSPSHIVNRDVSTYTFNVMTLLAYWTDRDETTCPTLKTGGTSCATANTWYDELIISTTWIEPPQAPPAAP